MTESQNNIRRSILALTFPPLFSGRPIMCNLAKHYALDFNILQASISPRREGKLVLELSGGEEEFQKGLSYLKEHGITVAKVSQQISRDEDSCIHCGICTALCPTQALSLDHASRQVVFDVEKCTACGACTRICPVHAMRVDVDDALW
ncbi:MAG: NIL domain-containing protein [Thermodesulfobacteriota bacterium]